MPHHDGPLTVESDVRVSEIRHAPTSIAGFLGTTPRGPHDRPFVVQGLEEFAATYGDVTGEHPLTRAVELFFLNGGREAAICRLDPGAAPLDEAHLIGPGLQAQRAGLWMLDGLDTVNVLCIPPFGPGRDVSTATWQAAAGYARARGAIVLVDPPRSWMSAAQVTAASVDALIADRDARACCALYWPRIRPRSAISGVLEMIPASGAVAGVYARTDARRGVWVAPAGREAILDGVAGLDGAPIPRDDQQRLQSLGINLIRALDVVHGPTVWGARTLAGADGLASEWKYVPVRRFASYVEQTLQRSLAWAVHEPNDETLWTAVRELATRLMTGLFQQGAVQGVTPREGFFVRCDRSTMTQDDIDNGRLVAEVGIAPLRPAEFIVLRIGVRTRVPTEEPTHVE